MIFSSSSFLLYFLPIFLGIYFLIKKELKNLLLLCASIYFYSCGAPRFIFTILITTTVDFYIVKFLYNSNTERRKKFFLILSLFLNLGMLIYFKYCNFFIENLNEVMQSVSLKRIEWVKVILPIGISFYTFESITYVVDVYRGVHKPLNNFLQYQMYILMFPKLIAGPIIRYHEISDQITDRSANDTIDNRLMGFYRFTIGLAKKVLIANTLAVMADNVFNTATEQLTFTNAWIGTLAYTFQIYFDFSGYSDMAIGLGRMLGFKFPENFSNPYTSQSITEFWRRWHITLGNWMKNYLYIPLGGNKTTKRKMYFNLWLVFLASGFWHGAAWTFIVWGMYHGFFLIIERAGFSKVLFSIGKVPATMITFLLVAIGWVFFRSDSLKQSFEFIYKLFSFDLKTSTNQLTPEFIFYLLLAICFSFFTLSKIGESIQQKVYYSTYNLNSHLLASITACILFILSLSSINSTGFNPFIYFRF